MFQKLSTLGALRHYDGSKGQAMVLYDVTEGKVTAAEYVADATFEHGEAHISVRLIQSSGEWQFLRFTVDSPFLLQ